MRITKFVILKLSSLITKWDFSTPFMRQREKNILVGLFQVPRESEKERIQGEIGGNETAMRNAAKLSRMRSTG